MTFGEKLRYQRNLRGMSPADFAAQLGVAEERVLQWESDSLPPNTEELAALQRAFGISADELLSQSNTAPGVSGHPYGLMPPFYTSAPVQNPQGRGLKSAALILFICSIMSVFLGVIIGDVAALSGNAAAVLVAYLVVALIPIASVVIGVVLNVKGIVNVKNIIAGVLAACFLFLFGAVAFMDSVDSEAPAEFYAIEDTLGIDLPEPDRVDEYEYYDGYDGINLTAYYSGTEADDLHDLITGDSRWLSERPTVMVGLFPESTGWYDYYLLYRVDTGTFNMLPAARGNYQYICICYDAASEMLEIYEYTVEFVPYWSSAL